MTEEEQQRESARLHAMTDAEFRAHCRALLDRTEAHIEDACRFLDVLAAEPAAPTTATNDNEFDALLRRWRYA